MGLPFRAVTTALLFSVLFLLSACGGGGGGGGTDSSGKYSISLSTSSLTFSGAQFVSIAPQTVTVTFRGDGVLVGTLPGQTLPTWLSVSQSSQPVNGQVQFSVSVNSTAAPIGASQATLRFVSGSASGSDVVYSDLAIGFQNKEGFSVTNAVQDYQGIAGTSTPTRTTLGALPTTTGETVSWTAKTNASWIKLGAVSSNVKGPVSYTIDITALPPGNYNDSIMITDSVSARTVFVIVKLVLTNPQLVMTPTSIVINVDPTTQLSQISIPLKISDQLGGSNVGYSYSWNLISRSNLVRLSKTSGSTLPSGSDLVVDLDPTLLSVTKTTQIKTFIDVSQVQNGSSFNNTSYIPVTVNVRLPMAGSFYPNIVTPGTSGTAHLIGNDFQDSDLPLLRLNGQVPAAVRRVNAQEVDLDYNNIAAGQYALTIQNGLGIPRSAAELSAIGTVTIGTGEVSTGGGRKARMVFDATRGVLYAVDYPNNELQRYQWNGSGYVALSSVAFNEIFDATMSRNNREVYVTSRWNGLYSVDATTTGTVTPQLRATNVELGCGNVLNVATPEDGSIYVTPFNNPCAPPTTASGQMAVSPITLQPSGKMTPYVSGLPSFYSAGIGTSSNGRYLASGSSDISGGGDFYLVDLRTNTTLFNGSLDNRYTHVTLDVNDAGTRTLVSNLWVRDNTATNVCDLPTNNVARLNSAGTKAYAYLHVNGGGGRIAVYNTTTAATTCTEIAAESVPVSYDMGIPDTVRSHDPNFAMTLVEDQKKVFLAGPARIVALSIQ